MLWTGALADEVVAEELGAGAVAGELVSVSEEVGVAEEVGAGVVLVFSQRGGDEAAQVTLETSAGAATDGVVLWTGAADRSLPG